MQDNQIVQLYLDRDESAITCTQTKYDRYLIKVAYNILKDIEDSRESVNDTYLAAWNSIPPNIPEILSLYLAKLTRRISVDIFRKRNRSKRRPSQYALSISELEECVSDGTSVEGTSEFNRLTESINSFLLTLSPDARNTFIGRYYFLDSVKEVARYCGMSEAKAKSMLYRTRCALKKYLEKEGFDI